MHFPGERPVMTGFKMIKHQIKIKYPNLTNSLITLREKVLDLVLRRKTMKYIFSEVFRNKVWLRQESVSGPGSDLSETAEIMKAIPEVIKEIDAKIFLDAPCGDFHWLKEVNLNVEKFIGVDVVPELIVINNRKYGNDKIIFLTLDITRDNIPTVDLIFCRDCLVHFSLRNIIAALKNFKKSGSKYLLTTTFTSTLINKDIQIGDWRPINLQMPPFNFPRPLKLINEKCSLCNGQYPDKCIGLWELQKINL
jgi:SAM-dependent methyltransferase